MNQRLRQISKFLSLILRHQPELIGIVLDENGWVGIDELVEAANQHGKELNAELVYQVVQNNDKQRFAINADKSRIRASQGHSIGVDLDLQNTIPPENLFHGTVRRFLDSIRRQGLVAGQRHDVHLSGNLETAVSVGQRRGRPIVLTIRSGEMHRQRFEFQLSANGVWLTKQVPFEFIVFPDED